MLDWLKDQLRIAETPNLAGETNAAIAASGAGAQRGANGSFDPNRVALPPELAAESNLIASMTNAQLGAMQDALKPPKRSGLQFLGDALSAASVPVAFAQGNQGYGLKMAGNTMADKFNQRTAAYEDALAKGTGDLLSGSYGKLGELGVGYLGEQRTKKSEARKQLGAMLAAAVDENGNLDPALLKQVKVWAGANGFQDIWNEVQNSLPINNTPAVEGPDGQPMGDEPDVPGAPDEPEVYTDAGLLGAQGPGMTELGMAGAPPPAAGSAPPAAPAAAASASPSDVPDVYETPPEIKKLYARANMMMSMDPERGKALLKTAEIADRAAANVWQKRAESKYDARSGEFATSNIAQFRNKKTNEMRPGQYGPRGVKISDMLGKDGKPIPEPNFNPEDWEYVGPAELSGLKASMGAQGKNQGDSVGAIPKIEATYSTIMDVVGKLQDSPGLENVSGKMLGGLFWSDQLPTYREETADAEALVESLNSNAFTLAFESLKGAGAITQEEGKAATAALTRLRNTRVSDKAYKEAIFDFVGIIEKLRTQAYQKAQQGFVMPGTRMSAPDPNAAPPPPGASSRTSVFDGLSDDELLARRPGGAR